MSHSTDNVAACRYTVPDYWTIGEVYERLIEDVTGEDEDDEHLIDHLMEVYTSWISGRRNLSLKNQTRRRPVHKKRCRVSVFRLVQQKLPDALHGQGGFSGWEHLEHMPHVVPNLQLAMHVIRQHPFAQANAIRV